MKHIIGLAASWALAFTAQAGSPAPVQASDTESLSLTVYPSEPALVSERRTARLPGGLARLQIGSIPAQIRPETVMLQSAGSAGLDLFEMSYLPARLSPQTLLSEHVGHEVGVLRGRRGGKDTTVERAMLLSVQNGIVLRFSDRIGTASIDRIVFDRLPEDLTARPILAALLESRPGDHALELSYQVGGLSWKADYVAQLSADGHKLDLSGWATLSNRSGTGFRNAALQLVAGELNRVQESRPAGDRIARVAMLSPAGAPAEEALLDYHLYRFERPLTLPDQQTLQLALLPVTSMPVRRQYLISGQDAVYPGRQEGGAQQLRPAMMIEFINPAAPAGKPLPAGTIRVHTRDRQNSLQFVGEDHIPHTAPGETVRLRLGSASDLPAQRRQTAYRKLDDHSAESSWRLNLRNASTQSVTVRVQETMTGDWTLIQESHPSRRDSAQTLSWSLDVPAGASVQLDYTVRQRW